MSEDTLDVCCPGCAKPYHLPGRMARQVVQCKCGTKFRVPPSGGPAVALKSCPACGVQCPVAAATCFKCGYNFETASTSDLSARP